jgi:hypothetical protein
VSSVNSPEEASYDVLEEASSLRLNKLSNHIAQDGAYGVEALIGCADVVEAIVVQQNLLDDKYGHSLAKL